MCSCPVTVCTDNLTLFDFFLNGRPSTTSILADIKLLIFKVVEVHNKVRIIYFAVSAGSFLLDLTDFVPNNNFVLCGFVHIILLICQVVCAIVLVLTRLTHARLATGLI